MGCNASFAELVQLDPAAAELAASVALTADHLAAPTPEDT